MTALERLAEFVCGPVDIARRGERIRLHTVDTVSAIDHGRRHVAPHGNAPQYAAAAARSTEMDDIHLESCITPGAAVIPTALHLASGSPRRFTEAVLVGYEVMIRFGMAIGGPRALGEGVWPSLFAAPMGSCAAACRAMKLSVSQTAGALAAAIPFCTGSCGPPPRAHVFGLAVLIGIEAAMAARQGPTGPADLLERYKTPLLDRVGKRFLFDQTGMKPYPTARQGLAAIEAARELGAADARNIVEIIVAVPRAQIRIIDRPGPLQTRLDSIASVQHQIAAALAAPSLMKKIRVEAAPDLERYYPAAWPARVTIRARGGERSRTILHPRGDFRNPLGWDEVVSKAPKAMRAGDYRDGFGRGGLSRLAAFAFSRKSRRSTM